MVAERLGVAPAATSRGAPARNRAIITFALCCAVALLDGADTQAMAVAAPAIARSLTITPAALGILFSVSLGGAALGALAFGHWADRHGPRNMLAICTCAFGLFQLLSATAAGFPTLLVLRFAAGVGLGGAAPCFLALAAASTPPARRATLLSVLWAFFPLGGLIGGLLNGWIVASHGWRTMFVLGGILPLLVAPILLAIADNGHHDRSVSRTGRASLRAAWAGDPTLRSRTILVGIVFFAAFGTLATIVVWTPTIVAQHGFDIVDGGRVLSWHALGALVSMTAAGAIVDRWGPRILVPGLIGSGVALAWMAASLDSFGSVAAAMVVLGLLLGVAASGGIAIAGRIFPPEVRSVGLGLSMAAGRAGQMVLPALTGWLIDRYGSAALSLVVLAAIPIVASAAAWMLSARLRQDCGR